MTFNVRQKTSEACNEKKRIKTHAALYALIRVVYDFSNMSVCKSVQGLKREKSIAKQSTVEPRFSHLQNSQQPRFSQHFGDYHFFIK